MSALLVVLLAELSLTTLHHHTQLLAAHIAEREAEGEEVDEEAEWDAWEVESNSDSDSSGGWNDVSSEGEDFNISDSDDDEDAAKSKAKGGKKRKVEEKDDEESPAPKKTKKGGKVVEVAGTIVEDKIDFGSESEDEEEVSDDQKENAEALAKKVVEVNADDGDEMSLTRATKVLAGSNIAELAMTKVRS